MRDSQQQWVIINKNTGTIAVSRVYLSEKTAISCNRDLNIGAFGSYEAVELKRAMLLNELSAK